MSNRTETQNAFETTLASLLNAGVLSVDFTSVVGLSYPLYVTLEPENPLKLEYLKVINISGNTVTFEARNLEGSVGDVDHDAGAIVRLTWTKQLQDDIFDDIETLETADTTHAGLTSIHHAKYTDAEVDAIVATHAAITDAHHTKYTDAEAAAKIAADALYALTGHTIVSHDTTGTGAELTELTDGSQTTLHGHAAAGALTQTFIFGESGEAQVKTGTHRLYLPFDITITEVEASVGVAPTGASLIVDVHVNGVTIFSSKPTIVASGFVDAGVVSDASHTDGQYITVDIDQIGSTLPGEDLTVVISYEQT